MPLLVTERGAKSLSLTFSLRSRRFFEFFTANIRNKNTRRAYYKAVCRFGEWCKGRGLNDLASLRPLHVAAYVEGLEVSADVRIFWLYLGEDNCLAAPAWLTLEASTYALPRPWRRTSAGVRRCGADNRRIGRSQIRTTRATKVPWCAAKVPCSHRGPPHLWPPPARHAPIAHELRGTPVIIDVRVEASGPEISQKADPNGGRSIDCFITKLSSVGALV